MDGTFEPLIEFSVIISKRMERLCLLLEDGIDSIRRIAALQLDDDAIVKQVCSCLLLIFRKSGLKKRSEVGLGRGIHGAKEVYSFCTKACCPAEGQAQALAAIVTSFIGLVEMAYSIY